MKRRNYRGYEAVRRAIQKGRVDPSQGNPFFRKPTPETTVSQPPHLEQLDLPNMPARNQFVPLHPDRILEQVEALQRFQRRNANPPSELGRVDAVMHSHTELTATQKAEVLARLGAEKEKQMKKGRKKVEKMRAKLRQLEWWQAES